MFRSLQRINTLLPTHTFQLTNRLSAVPSILNNTFASKMSMSDHVSYIQN